jgi:hypothetical protein
MNHEFQSSKLGSRPERKREKEKRKEPNKLVGESRGGLLCLQIFKSKRLREEALASKEEHAYSVQSTAYCCESKQRKLAERVKFINQGQTRVISLVKNLLVLTESHYTL